MKTGETAIEINLKRKHVHFADASTYNCVDDQTNYEDYTSYLNLEPSGAVSSRYVKTKEMDGPCPGSRSTFYLIAKLEKQGNSTWKYHSTARSHA